MTEEHHIIRVHTVCAFCHAQNTLTLECTNEDLPVHCSRCGADFGTVAGLRTDPFLRDADGDTVWLPPGTVIGNPPEPE